MAQPLALIVEDDQDIAYFVEQALQAAQFETRVVADGLTALTVLADTCPVLVILDLNLPHVSGRRILRIIRADERLNQTKVILTTANPFMVGELQEEADLVLVKPVSFKQLRDLASRLVPTDSL
jgi:DNA-binding response OmpR family regulator